MGRWWITGQRVVRCRLYTSKWPRPLRKPPGQANPLCAHSGAWPVRQGRPTSASCSSPASTSTSLKGAPSTALLHHLALTWSPAVNRMSGYKSVFFSLWISGNRSMNTQYWRCVQIERLFSSSLVAIIGLKAPRKLKVWHLQKGTEICNYSYSNMTLALSLNRQRLRACLEVSEHAQHSEHVGIARLHGDAPNLAGKWTARRELYFSESAFSR